MLPLKTILPETCNNIPLTDFLFMLTDSHLHAGKDIFIFTSENNKIKYK
jgi:hypothetical protein